MKKMPEYDVTEYEQELIDQVPIAVNTKDADYIVRVLTELYKNEEYQDLLSALMIIEKYIFRAYELIYFVEGKGIAYDFEEFFFDEEIHNRTIEKAKKALNKEDAERKYQAGVNLVKEGNNDEATPLFKASALGGSVNGAYNYGVSLCRGEGCDVNELEGAFWYWVAACQCHPRACANLAMCFQDGKGVCADEMTMLYWYLRSGLAGNVDSMKAAANLLINQLGIPGQEYVGTQMLLATDNLEDSDTYELLMDTAFNLCGFLEPYIYNRYFEE